MTNVYMDTYYSLSKVYRYAKWLATEPSTPEEKKLAAKMLKYTEISRDERRRINEFIDSTPLRSLIELKISADDKTAAESLLKFLLLQDGEIAKESINGKEYLALSSSNAYFIELIEEQLEKKQNLTQDKSKK